MASTPQPGCPVFVKRARQVVVRGAMRRGDGSSSSVGSLARALAVLADGDPEQPAMKVVAAEHAQFPSSTRLTFDLGPDDGSPLHFDVYEQERSADGIDAVSSRAVVRAHLVRERGYDRAMAVTFELGSDGLFKIGPTKAWRLEWAAAIGEPRLGRLISRVCTPRAATPANESLESFSSPSKFAALSAGQKSAIWVPFGCMYSTWNTALFCSMNTE